MSDTLNHIQKTDPQVFQSMQLEWDRQQYGLEMIASENYAPRIVSDTLGTVMVSERQGSSRTH